MNVSAQEMMAGSNRNIKNYDEAVYWYGELCKLKNIKPEWALYYAEALANKEKYEQSEQWYRKFLSMKPSDRRADAFSKANLNSFSQGMQVNTRLLIRVSTQMPPNIRQCIIKMGCSLLVTALKRPDLCFSGTGLPIQTYILLISWKI
jgi:tetratricopeptide (TPR) repeat protein